MINLRPSFNFVDSLINWYDFLIIIPLLLVIIFFANRKKNNHIEEEPAYKYYLPGLIARIISGIIFCFVYVHYYKGGDSISYYYDSYIATKILNHSFSDFLKLLFFGTSDKAYWYGKYGMDMFQMVEEKSYFVVRLITPLTLITLKSYIATTILLLWICYGGIFKLYLVFVDLYPNFKRQLALSVLFVPSIMFWSSGILKDSITLAAVGYFTSAFYEFFIKKKFSVKLAFVMIISMILLITIKPYILIALLPAMLIWGFYAQLNQLQNRLLKIFFLPLVIVVSLLIATSVLSLFKSSMGTYSSLDKIIYKAQLTQQDLVRSEQYGHNYFNIGTFDASFSSIMSKFPAAVFAGLFRPLIWEARNITVFMSALENTLLLLICVYILFRVGLVKMLQFIQNEPLLFFSIIFAIFFAFSVGLTTANFGALVRYRIPASPFFISSLLIMYLKLTTKQVDENISETK